MRPTVGNRCAAAFVAAFVATAPVAASAQPAPAPEPPDAAHAPSDAVVQAKSHFAHGVKLYEEEDYRAALIEFSRAYELAPNWAVLYNVGQSHYQLRDYPSALRTLEKYVQEGGDQIAKERRSEVDKEMDELRGRVAHVAVTTNIAGADLSLDDAPIGKSPLRDLVLIGAGRHKVTASKPGYLPASKVVDVAGADNLALALDLTEEPHREGAHPASPNYVATAIFLGVGVAGVAVGAIYGVATVSNKGSLSGACNRETKLCPPSEQGDLDAFSRNGAISTVGFGVGIGGLALGTVLLFLERSKEHEAPPPDELPSGRATIAPWVGPGGAGVAGTF